MAFLDDAGVTKLTSYLQTKIKNLLSSKQDTLVSGTNIKTINNTSLLGSGNITTNDYATNSKCGVVKPWYYHSAASAGPTAGSNSNPVLVNSISTTAGKYYAVESDVNGRMFVNVPWTDGATLIDLFYPVGSYYETSDTSFDPNTTWGGTWVLELEGQVHVSGVPAGNYEVDGANQANGVGVSDGGVEKVTLTADEIPAHTHGSKSLSGYFTIRKTYNQANNIVSVDGIVSSGNSGSGGQTATNGTSTSLQQITINASHEHTSVGGGQAHENMPPYIVVNRWHRTA